MRRLAWLAVLLITAWLLSITLRPGGSVEPKVVHLQPFATKWPALVCVLQGCSQAARAARFLWIDVLGNIAVFVPFGGAVALAVMPAARQAGRRASGHPWPRWWLKIAGAGFGLSLAIELAQLRVPGRVTDIDDLILNVTGTLLGGAAVACLLAATRHVTRQRGH